MNKLSITINNELQLYEIDKDINGVSIETIVKNNQQNYKGYISLIIIDNKLKEISEVLREDCSITLLDTTNTDGLRVYFRTMSFIFIMACNELFEKEKVVIEHSLSGGLYCEIHKDTSLSDEDLIMIKNKMQEIIDRDYKINKITVDKEEAMKIFHQNNLYKKADLFEYKDTKEVRMYECNGYIDYFYGYMMPSTGYIKVFDLKLHKKGIIVLGPDKVDKSKPTEYKPQPKLSDIYHEAENWSKLIGIDDVVSLNKVIENNSYGEIIRIVEALHEKKLAHIADMIRENNKRIILIAAPSSSGKTSFANRLSIHLKVNHLRPISISLDDYFVDREKTPLDEFGNYDFESIYSIDLEQFNKDLNQLLQGEEIEVPRFNFRTGKREYLGKKLKIEKDQPIILEGIHGLNPMLTSSILDKEKFKIYISALTQINLDNHNRIPTTDLRLIRRIVRDFNFRGYSAEKTIMQWDSVRRGEVNNIFPYQEEADVIFNSACIYELAVLKKYAAPLLKEIQNDSPAYIEANRINKFLQYFLILDDISDIPPISILREFIGGSKIVD